MFYTLGGALPPFFVGAGQFSPVSGAGRGGGGGGGGGGAPPPPPPPPPPRPAPETGENCPAPTKKGGKAPPKV